MTYDGASLAEIAADLTRTMGHRVTDPPTIARRRLTVTLDVDAMRGDPTLLGRLLDVSVRVRVHGRQWTLAAR